ncbi:putative HTH-type transcriptional regulator [Candidatus Bilamarchaeum dharawalense]|uniref:Putative HTH-type transcriptional regulator n=1 Tax=Candidatus Bilamarchaeum dharawalense TaxID=2885759 RepID=A0A5E4LMH0_9ARCH|nr:putative HTH-type transcriptional regulator [Candidatus Bilamarchaeum dharawalense]
MEKKIDEIDRELLKLLEVNAKARIHSIARKISLPASTVHHRIKKLEEDGLISSWTIKKNFSLLGLNMKAHILTFVDLSLLTQMKRTQKDVANDIKKIDGVEAVDIVTGDADLLVTVRCRDMNSFQDLLLQRLQSIKGITKTKTMIVVAES